MKYLIAVQWQDTELDEEEGGTTITVDAPNTQQALVKARAMTRENHNTRYRVTDLYLLSAIPTPNR